MNANDPGVCHAQHARELVACACLSLLTAVVGPIAGCSENSLLIPDPSVRYIAFGDSSTSGRASRSYPEVLAGLLEVSADEIANQGSDGENSSSGLKRLRRLVSARTYPNARALLYWEGGADIMGLMRQVDPLLLLSPRSPDYPYTSQLNEVLDRAQTNITAAIGEAQAAGLSVYVATYFSAREATAQCDPLFLDVILPGQAQNANGYVFFLNERIRAAAAESGATLVDIASADDVLHADAANYVNCNHLSAAGNEIVARLFFDALKQ